MARVFGTFQRPIAARSASEERSGRGSLARASGWHVVFRQSIVLAIACHCLCPCFAAAAEQPAKIQTVLIKDVPFIVQNPTSAARPARPCGCESSAKGSIRITSSTSRARSGRRPRLLTEGTRRGGAKNRLPHRGRSGTASPPRRPIAQRRCEWEALAADLRAGVPSIVCMHYDDGRRRASTFASCSATTRRPTGRLPRSRRRRRGLSAIAAGEIPLRSGRSSAAARGR